MKKEKILKVLRKSKLSNVYLVKIGKNILVKKVVHKDFTDEFYKQKYFSKYGKKIKIPKIISINKREHSCLMEYIPHKKNNLKLKEVFDILYDFHNEFENCKSKLAIYNFNRFYNDFLNVKKYLPDGLKDLNKSKLKNIFEEVFNIKFSVIHGDFHKDQIFKSEGNSYLIDFAGSFYGPRILDYAYYFRENKKINPFVFKYIDCKSDKQLVFIKSLIVILIFDLNWLLNRLNYEAWPKEKMKKISQLIKFNFRKL